MTPEQHDKMVKQLELKADFYAPDNVIVEGQTPAYVEYQKEMVKRRVDELQHLIVRTIEVMQARNNEQMGVIGELMRQNQVLKEQAK